jgi:chitodextrinase
MCRAKMFYGAALLLFLFSVQPIGKWSWLPESAAAQEPEFRFLNQNYIDSLTLNASYPNWVVSQLWLRDLVKQFFYESMKWQSPDGHIYDGLNEWRIDDEAELFLNWIPYYLLSGDEKIYTAVRKALFLYLARTKEKFDHGYFKDAYFDTEHTLEAMIMLANLAYAKPNDTEVITALRDVVEHCANLVPGYTPWFNTTTKHLRSLRPGTKEIDESCPYGIDWPFNLQFAKMAMAYYNATKDVRYFNWAGEYLDGWIGSMELNERLNGAYMMPWEVDPKTGAMGTCSEKWWDDAFAPGWGWELGSMEAVRDMRGAFLDYYRLTKNRRYMDAIKKQINFTFDHSSNFAPAIWYRNGQWINDERSFSAAPIYTAASLLDDEVQPLLESRLLRWYENIDSQTLEQLFWHFRRYGKYSSMQAIFDRTIGWVQGNVNEFKTLTSLPDPDRFPDLEGMEGLTMSYFGGLPGDRGEMPWTEVLYLKQDGTLGIEEGIASMVERSDDSLRVLAMFNTNSQSRTIKLQADYVSKIIRSMQINSDAPVAVKGRLATITLPPEQLVRVTLRVTGSDTIPPLAPTNLRTTASSGSSISLAWAPPSLAGDNETASLYQIKRNGVQVARTDSLTFTDIGLQEGTAYGYDVYSIDISGNISTTSVTGNFSTIADRAAPVLLSAALYDSATLVLRFNEKVTLATATIPSNYTISPTIQVLQAVRSSDKMGVTLKTSAHQEHTPYSVLVKNVTDSSKARNAVNGAQLSYTLIRSLSIRNLSLSNYKVRTAVNGDSVFLDRAYTIQILPDLLLKQWRIVTANNDKGNTSNPFFSFSVNQYVNVYVAYDRRLTTPPSWLQSWTATTAVVKTSDSEYLCYKKNFPPGTISLGGNCGTGSCSMYMIFVEPGNDRTPPSAPTGLVALPWSTE